MSKCCFSPTKMEMRTIPSSPSMMKRTGPGTHPDRVRFFAKTFVR